MTASSRAARTKAPTRASPWRAPWFIKASVGLHLGAGALALAQPDSWSWALGSVALDHALITATGLWPRSTWLGANISRLPPSAAARGEVAITFDDGPDAVTTPQVLDLLDAHGAAATFFCIGRHAEQQADLCREIVRRGHAIENHSFDHRATFSLLGPAAMAAEVARAQASLIAAVGRRPRFFRAPAGLRNPFLGPALHALDLRLVSWTRRGFDTVRNNPADVLSRLTRGLAAGDILLLHDHGSALAPSGRPVVLEVLPDLLRAVADAGLQTVTLAGASKDPGASTQSTQAFA